MKRTVVSLVCATVLLCAVSACIAGGAPPLFPVPEKGKSGYMDQQGKLVIEARFSYAERFQEGLAAVSVEGKSKGEWLWGFIDETGALVIEPQFQEAAGFSGGLAEVRQDLYGYINPAGVMVIAPTFAEIKPFSEGLAAVRAAADPGRRWGYINTQGGFAIPTQYEVAADFHEGLAAVQQAGKFGYIDPTGAFVVPPAYREAHDFSEGLAAAKLAGDDDPPRIVYLDKSGKTVLELRGYDMGDFRDGLAPVNTNVEFGVGKNNVPIIRGSWGFVDKTGRMVIPAKYAEARDFSEGLAAVNVDSVFVPKWGFVDRNGRMVIEPQFTATDGFQDGLAKVHLGRGTKSQRSGPGDFAVTMDLGQPGYIDTTGRFVRTPPR